MGGMGNVNTCTIEVKVAQGEVLDHKDLSLQPGKGIKWSGGGSIRNPPKLGSLLVLLKKCLVCPKPKIRSPSSTKKVALSPNAPPQPVLILFTRAFSLHSHVALAAAWLRLHGLQMQAPGESLGTAV